LPGEAFNLSVYHVQVRGFITWRTIVVAVEVSVGRVVRRLLLVVIHQIVICVGRETLP
jgi:hypothetical protein